MNSLIDLTMCEFFDWFNSVWILWLILKCVNWWELYLQAFLIFQVSSLDTPVDIDCCLDQCFNCSLGRLGHKVFTIYRIFVCGEHFCHVKIKQIKCKHLCSFVLSMVSHGVHSAVFGFTFGAIASSLVPVIKVNQMNVKQGEPDECWTMSNSVKQC